MKNIFKNKRIMFPIIIFIVVIIIAILIFVIIGTDSKKSKSVSGSPLKLENSSNNTSNTTTNITNETDDEEDNNTSNNTSKNNTKNNTTDNSSDDNSDDEEISFDGEDYYLDAVKSFTAGLMDEKDMETFVGDHIDLKAYVAYYNVEADDTKFLDEYEKLDDDDQKIDQVKDEMVKLADKENVKLTSIGEPKQSKDREEISRLTITVDTGDNEQKYRLVFYQDIVIYICDENGDSIINLD